MTSASAPITASSLPPAVDTSHCPLPLKSPRIIQWGRTDGEASQPDVWRQRTSERTPHYIPFPSSPFSICSCRSLPRSLAIPERTNERERRSRGDLCLNHSERRRRCRLHREVKRERESVGRPYRRGCGLTPWSVDGGVERRFPPFIALARSFPRGRFARRPDAQGALPAGRAISRQQPRWRPRLAAPLSAVVAILVESWAELRIGNSLADGGSEGARPPAGRQHIGHGRPGGRRADELSSTDAVGAADADAAALSLLPFTEFYNDPLERVRQMRTPTETAARISASRSAASAAQTAAIEGRTARGALLLLCRRRRRPLRVRDKASRSGGELQQQCRVRRSRVNIVEPDNFVLCAFAT